VSGCGEWQRPTLRNPTFKGKWRAPLIANPAYIGEWAAKKIPNPDYFEDSHPNKFTSIVRSLSFLFFFVLPPNTKVTTPEM